MRKVVFETTKTKVADLKQAYPEFCSGYPRDMVREDKWERKMLALLKNEEKHQN